MIERILTDNWDDYRKDALPKGGGIFDLATHLLQKGMAVPYKEG